MPNGRYPKNPRELQLYFPPALENAAKMEKRCHLPYSIISNDLVFALDISDVWSQYGKSMPGPNSGSWITKARAGILITVLVPFAHPCFYPLTAPFCFACSQMTASSSSSSAAKTRPRHSPPSDITCIMQLLSTEFSGKPEATVSAEMVRILLCFKV